MQKVMSLPLVFGVNNRPPFLMIDKSGQLTGTSEPYFCAQYYFLTRKFNVTFVRLTNSARSLCLEDGICTGSLSSLQSGSVDFARRLASNRLPTAPINITLSTVLGEDKCHLINTDPIKIKIRSQHFIDFEERFDYPVSLISILFCFCLIGIFLLTNKFLHNLPKKTKIWNLFGIALNADRIHWKNLTSLHLLIFSLFAFFMVTLFTASLQTGLIVSVSYNHIENIDDIVKYNYTPITVASLNCRYSIERSTIPSLKKIQSKMLIISKVSADSILETIHVSERVLIESIQTAVRLKGAMCIADEFADNRIHISVAPISQFLFLFALSAFTDPKIKTKANFYAGRAFESGNTDNNVMRRIDFDCFGFKNYYNQCVQNKEIDENIVLTSLKFSFFDELLGLYFIGGIICSIAFLLEAIFAPKELQILIN